jgi:hypothetical protein
MLRKDPNYVDLDIQPIRSFGLKLLASIFLLFFGVLILTIGFDALWTFLVRIMYR